MASAAAIVRRAQRRQCPLGASPLWASRAFRWDRQALDLAAAESLPQPRRARWGAGVEHRQNRLLTTAIQKHQQVEKQLADILEASPKLAKRLADWQAEDAKT